MTTNYRLMKDHFDMLITGGYPRNSGLEPIRSTYEECFNKKINRYDVYLTNLKVQTNPIAGLITLIGPDDDTLPTGLIGDGGYSVYYVTHFTNDVLKPMDSELMESYIWTVYRTMNDIIDFDSFKKPERMACNHPYLQMIYMIPFYFTFHHIKECFSPDHTRYMRIFSDILELCTDSDNIPSILESINGNKFTTDSNKIYSIMTCNNTISFI